MIEKKRSYEAIVIGVSAGGLAALTAILPQFESIMDVPVLIVQHMSSEYDDFLVRHFNGLCKLKVQEAYDKESIEPGHIYFAPPNYHLLVEPDKTIALSVQERVNYSRPAIDVLFESAADAFSDKLIGVLLTGANTDGTSGIIKIKAFGGVVIVQDPETAEADTMPLSAIKHTDVDHVIPLDGIARFINRLIMQEN